MKISNKILIGGMAFAAVIFSAGLLNERRLHARVESLVAECEAENEKTAAMPLPPPGYTLDQPKNSRADRSITADEILGVVPEQKRPSSSEPYWSDVMVCDASALSSLTVETGIQRKIADTYMKARNSTGESTVLAVIIAVLAVIPWLWYFLLRRVVELRNAIGGRSPDG